MVVSLLEIRHQERLRKGESFEKAYKVTLKRGCFLFIIDSGLVKFSQKPSKLYKFMNLHRPYVCDLQGPYIFLINNFVD